jgi:hypothetical protein
MPLGDGEASQGFLLVHLHDGGEGAKWRIRRGTGVAVDGSGLIACLARWFDVLERGR